MEVFNASSASNTTIYVGGITTGLNETLLMKAFQEFGEIKEIRIFKEKGFSFIRFVSHAAATRAIVTMHGRPVGDQSCKCSWGKEPNHTNRVISSAASGTFEQNGMNPTSTSSPTSNALLSMNVGTQNVGSLTSFPIFPNWPGCYNSVNETSLSKMDCAKSANVVTDSVGNMSSLSRSDMSTCDKTLQSSSTSAVVGVPHMVKLSTIQHQLEQIWSNRYYNPEIDGCVPALLLSSSAPMRLQNVASLKPECTKTALSNLGVCDSPYYPKFDLNAAILPSSGQPSGQLPCDISNSMLPESLSIPLHGLPALHPGVMPVKPFTDRSFYPSYPIMASLAPCQLANNLPLSMENVNVTLGLSAENTLASAMQLASLPQSYGLPMHNQTVMSISLSLADLANAGPYGCGFLQQENNIPRIPLVSTMNGVSSLC
ncbi:hypothetical protein EG68_00054 [Paragonimus skrjabini miyazakii]|uniref:RRM domain-containing protein n=1 Tax=Paragonimus skrjabini miyazakii TaxID=59628 RepID=A0A8S9Z7P0_9TREM|nr:hypothetical protein EG68_00054 [Paragonimus skrjabini miyazakii]